MSNFEENVSAVAMQRHVQTWLMKRTYAHVCKL